MYGRRPRCKRNLTISEAFGCGHVFGLSSLGGLPLSRCSRYGRWPCCNPLIGSQTKARAQVSRDPSRVLPIDGLDRFASMPSSPLQFMNAQTLPHLPAARVPTPLPQAQAPEILAPASNSFFVEPL